MGSSGGRPFPWAALILLVLMLGALGAAIALLASAGDVRDPAGPRIGAAAFAAVAVLLGALGWSLWRKGRPRVADHFVLEAPGSARRGEAVDARLRIKDPAKVGERIDVGIVCTEYYDVEVTTVDSKGHTRKQRKTREATAHEEWRPAGKGQALQGFQFTIPADAPYSHKGNCLSFRWRLTAREPSKFRFDPTSEQALEVAP